MTTPDFGIFVDWDNDGEFDGTGEDVTDRVRVRSPLSLQYGRDQARSLAPIQPGQAVFELDNTSGDYNPENTSSAVAGNVLPGRPVLVKATLDDIDYVLYRGFLDGFDVMPDLENRSVQLSALDAFARFREVKLSTALHHSVQTGDAIGLILDELGWPDADRDIDQGATTIRWWWEEGTDAFTALTRVVDSEGPGSLVTVGTDGKFVFRGRHSRLIDSASLTSQATISEAGDGAEEPAMSPPFGYDVGWRDIINSVSISIDERIPDPLPSVVFETEQTYVVPQASAITINVESSDPFMEAITPVAGTDFTVLSGSVTVSLSRTSGASAAITVRAPGDSGAVVSGMRLRARSVPVVATFQVTQDDPLSIEQFGVRSYSGDPRWAGVHDALAVADLVLAHRSQSRPVIKIRLKAATAERIEQQLSRDLSDRITIVAPSIDLDADFYVEQIQHSITGVRGYFETTFGCEMVPRGLGKPFQFDVAGHGFNAGAFGGDDPDTILRFDTTGQGFGDGVFAT